MTIWGWHKIKGPKMAVCLLCLALALLGGLWAWRENRPEEAPQPALALALLDKTIVIDAGHGGFDPGAIGASGIYEKDINLAISRRVASLLRQVGAQVVETRRTEGALAGTKREDMQRRVEIAEECEASLFVTIQANSIPQREQHGAQVFYATGSAEGQGVSQSIQQSLGQVLQNTNRQAKSIDNIYVVKRLDVPTVVVECGFLSNAEEEALLADSRYQHLVAYAIFLGIVSYYSEQPVAVQYLPAE